MMRAVAVSAIIHPSLCPALVFVEAPMVRSLLTVTGSLALALSLLTPLGATPITIVPNTVNSFRDSRGVNDLNIGGSGEINQLGASIIPAAGSTLTAVQGGFTVGPTTCAPLAINANFCASSPAFNASRLGSWTLTFRNGIDTAVIATPTLAGAETAVPFPQNVTIGRTDHPTISFTIPAGFTPDAFRVVIFDKNVTLANGQKDVIFSEAVAANATSFTIPSTLTLKPGNPYTINLQLIDLRPGFTEADFLASNNNAMILRRSSSYFDFQILPSGAPPVVELPTVGPDPNPNDGFGAPYQFHVSITDRQVRFIDPLIAIGYDYAIGTGDPNFASVIFPNVGDSLYELSFGSTTQTVAAGVEFFFPAGGVSQFSVRGIETSAGLDPNDVTAFITGLTWVGLGEFTGTMTPVVLFVPDVAVPLPGGLGLVGVGLVALAWATRRSWPRR
jgi:hypothetical protein